MEVRGMTYGKLPPTKDMPQVWRNTHARPAQSPARWWQVYQQHLLYYKQTKDKTHEDNNHRNKLREGIF